MNGRCIIHTGAVSEHSASGLRRMTVGSLFSGIGGLELGFERAGMRVAWQAECDTRALRVLEHHWPDVRRYHDVREVGRACEPVDVVCGGFPCQDVSVAGRRKGLAGERSGLWFEFHRVLEELRPGWTVIENVPGLLSSHGGRDFATVIRGLVKLGYGVCWRVLDAQYFGVPQRRRRVFIVGHLGAGRAAEVLFEREGLPWYTPPRLEAGKVSATIPASGSGTSRVGQQRQEPGFYIPVARALCSHGQRIDGESETFIPVTTHSLSAEGADASEDGTGRGTPLVPVYCLQGGGHTSQKSEGLGVSEDLSYTLNCMDRHAVAFDTTQITSKANRSNPQPGDPCHTLQAGAHAPAVAFETRIARNGRGAPEPVCPPLKAESGKTGCGDSAPCIIYHGIRRLMPVECERLQGFPDGWTDCLSDSGRYQTLGNAVAVPVAEWIAKRIVEAC